MNEIIKIISQILALFGMAADAKSKLDDRKRGQPPTNIGSLDMDDPIQVGDFTFDLMQAEMRNKHQECAAAMGFKDKEAAEDAINRIRIYQMAQGNEAFSEQISARVGERSRELMSRDPLEIAKEYADWQQPAN